MANRIMVDDVTPSVSGGAATSKAVVGEHVPVRAVIWREGHAAVGGTVRWRGPAGLVQEVPMRPGTPGTDSWVAELVPDTVGTWTFQVEGWGDPWATWTSAVWAKADAGAPLPELAVELEIGARLLEQAAQTAPPHAPVLTAAADLIRRPDLLVRERLRAALSPAVTQVLEAHPLRELVSAAPVRTVEVERRRALVGSWYEFFPRSTGGRDATGTPVHGTFRTAEAELERIAGMGFDVVYLPPVHPIGELRRKGRGNREVAGPGDVGSPWAVGSAAGGHDAVHPELGSTADFAAFVARARALGLEVALDLAMQCAPDHPWVQEHPEWFRRRPDGTIAHAENPPKQYQDIYPIDVDADPVGVREELLRVVLHWVGLGVRIFRVDNPHTKPPDLWAWLIAALRRRQPDVVLLAEAFTRPARLFGLARLGFSQSYSYFTWRTTVTELTEFGAELVARADEARPNLFVNTPDILPRQLQGAPPAMFALRAALAATLSPSWGVYAGYELLENEPAGPDTEEYRDSEKYALRPRDFTAPHTLQPWLTRLNEIRRAHPALQQLRTLRFHPVDGDELIAYSKTDPESGEVVLVVVTLDPHGTREGIVHWDLPALGLPAGSVQVRDEVGGEHFEWSAEAYVKLGPDLAVAHIAQVIRP